MDYDQREVKSYANTKSLPPLKPVLRRKVQSRRFFPIRSEFVALNVRDGNFFFLVYTYFSLFLIS